MKEELSYLEDMVKSEAYTTLEPPSLSWSSWEWANFMVASRSLTLEGRLVLIPWLDLTEHTHDAPRLGLSEDKKGLILSGMDFEEGIRFLWLITLSLILIFCPLISTP